MNHLFTPALRDNAIETTCSNMVMAGLLEPHEVGMFMTRLTGLDDYELGRQFCASLMLLDSYYERNTLERRN